MEIKPFPTWEQFVAENLLQSGLFSGLCLISNHQEAVYTYGTLINFSKVDLNQIFRMFTCRGSEVIPTLLNLHVDKAASATSFRVYHRTNVSVYATTSGNQSSLTISKLPHGIFVALFHQPVVAHKAITLVEDFTDKLRC